MAFGREVHEDVEPRAGKGVAQGGGVADIGFHEREARAGRHGLEGGKVADVGQLVEHTDKCHAPGDELARDGGAYEAGAAGEKHRVGSGALAGMIDLGRLETLQHASSSGSPPPW